MQFADPRSLSQASLRLEGVDQPLTTSKGCQKSFILTMKAQSGCLGSKVAGLTTHFVVPLHKM